MPDIERKLATIRKVKEIIPIENADNIKLSELIESIKEIQCAILSVILKSKGKEK